jgi:hypothetical protein
MNFTDIIKGRELGTQIKGGLNSPSTYLHFYQQYTQTQNILFKYVFGFKTLSTYKLNIIFG